MNKQSNTEEIDILQFFSAIGQMFGNFFRFVTRIFIEIFNYLVKFLFYFRKNIIYLGLGLLLGGVLSFFIKNESEYYTQAMIKTNYDAQIALIEKVDVINNLIEKDSINKLAKLLNIETSQASHLSGVEISPVIDDILLMNEYENYLKSKDTTVYKYLDFESYKNNFQNNLQLNKFWSIRFTANTPSAFKNFNDIFKNIFNKEEAINKRKNIYLKSLNTSRQRITQSLKDIDSLRNLYNTILIENTKKENTSSMNIVLGQGDQTGPETKYDLFKIREKLTNNLANIDKEIELYNDTFIMYNNFTNYGIKDNSILKNTHVKYPIYGFLLVLFILLIKDFNMFITNYEKKINRV